MKRSFYLLIVSMLLPLLSAGQEVFTFEQAKEMGIRTTELDSLYPSAINVQDSTLSIFRDNPAQYDSAYRSMLMSFGKFLWQNGFRWTQPAKGFNRIYFDENGRIAFFLYKFRPEQVTPEQAAEFHRLLTEFAATYQFPLKASRGFAQCSPFTYMP